MKTSLAHRCGFIALIVTIASWQNAFAQRPKAAGTDPFAAPPTQGEQPRRRAAEEEAERTANRRGGRSLAVERIELELNRATEIDVVEMPFKDCVIYLQDRHQIPIVLNAKQLDAANVPLDSAITKSLRGITLRSALNLMLADLDCSFLIKDEVLQITSAAHARQISEIRVYDCRDMLGPIDPARGPSPRDGNFGGMRPRPTEHEQRGHKLIALIVANVDPDTWQSAADNDQPEPRASGAVSEYDGLLVVTQAAKTHEKVERLLNMLREAAGLETRPGHVVR